MYELKLDSKKLTEFKKKARYLMLKKEISTSDLSHMTGYSVGAIYNFFSQSDSQSRFIVYAIAEALKM